LYATQKQTGYVSRQTGFTLIELLVVITLIGILAIAAIPSFMRGIRGATFKNTVNSVAILYETARTQALASELDAEQKIPPGGFGVLLDFGDLADHSAPNQKATLFIDDWNAAAGAAVKVDYADITGRVLPDGIFTPDKDTVLKEVQIDLLNYIELSSIQASPVGETEPNWYASTDSQLVTIYRPPFAETTLVGLAPNQDLQEFTAEFKLISDDLIRRIKLNRVTTTLQIIK
jgi:prepilin-type N-terminal cleavage/methylation domain-containing protein